MQGAQAKGDGITVDVGRDLRIESLQDSDNYHSTQTNTGINIGGSLTGLSGGMNADRTKMDSDFASVNKQSGLFAGNQGVDIDVEGNTHLKGGIIASEGKNNSLNTGTLTFDDIQNNAEFDVSSSGMGLSGNLNFGQAAQDEGKGGFSTPGASQSHHSGNAENRTQATIGNNVDITIKDEANQTQDIATLNRDTDNAHQSLDNLFDKDKEQERLDEQKLISDIGNQLSNIVRTEGQIRAENAKNDNTALAEAERELRAEGKNPTEQEIKQRAENNAMRDWGTGGKYQQITQAITGALQGAFNGDLTQALANGSAPFLAEAIKNATTNPDGTINTEANLAAHAILGALLSQANGNSALAGGLGALTAEAAANLIKNELYGDKSFADLTDAERQNISALAQIAAAVAGGLASDSSSDAAQGAIAGKNAVENNYLSSEDKSRQTCLRNKNNLTEQESAELLALNQLDAATSQALLDACLKGSPDACEAARKDAIEKQASYQDLTYQYPKEAQEGYQRIMELLNGTSPEAISMQQYMDGLIQNYVRWGYSENEAKGILGYQLGLMYVVGGISSGYSLKNMDVWLKQAISGYSFSTQQVNSSGGRIPVNNRLAVDEEAAGWSQYNQYRNADGSWNWPPNNGAIPGTESQVILPPGLMLDRFGLESGVYVSPSGVPYPQRALAPGSASYSPSQYIITKPIEAQQGTIAPAFGEPGGGIQYKFKNSIKELIAEEKLERLNK